MVSVKEVFDLAIEIDLIDTAHRIYWAISKQLINLSDDSNRLNYIAFEDNQINEMIKQNVLKIGQVKLFVIHTISNLYAFYLAKNSIEAYKLHYTLFREKAKNILAAERLMVKTMYFANKEKEMNMYEYRKQVIEVPAYVGHARAGEYKLYQVGVIA